MKNRSLTLLLSASLGLAGVPSALAQATPATVAPGSQSPTDPQLTGAKVSLQIGTYTGPLSSLLAAVAKSAGYDLIFETNVDTLAAVATPASPATPAPANGLGTAPSSSTPSNGGKPVVYNFKDAPFNQVWPVLMDVYGLTYKVASFGTTPIIRVGVSPVQQIIKLPTTLDVNKVTDQLKRAFGSVVRTSQTVSNSNNQNAASSGAGSAASTTTNSVTSGEDVVLDSPTLKIVAEPSSNSVIVRGTNSEVLQVQNLAASIIANQPASLASVAPVPTVQRIYNLNGPQSDVTAVLSAQYPDLKVTPTGQTRQLILTGAQNQVEAALALLGTIDPVVATSTAQRIYSVKGQQADIVALLASQYPNLKVTAVGQTGQLVIGGSQTQLDAALTLLSTVDRPAPTVTGATIVQKVFPLTNASADDVKAVLEGTLQRDLSTGSGLIGNAAPVVQPDGTTVLQPPSNTQTGTAATGTAQAATTAQAGTPAGTPQATIISDKRTNTLIIRGTQAQVDQIAQIIPSLDVRVPQVNVQVRIQEVTESASRSLGVDWKAGFGNFVVNVASSAVTAIFDPTRSLVGFNLGATLNALETQGMTKRVYDGAVTMQSGQRQLGSTTDTQNASNGAAAHLQSGGRLELNIPSAAANVPAIQRQIDYGVTLDFYNPQVAPDGTITLRVKGAVNQPKTAITGSTLPNLLDFSNSEAQTTITFKSGETVLLSGLLGTNQTSTNTGIPFLSSIPVIGALFGTQRTSNDRSQLLVVITGNVLQ
ncbi:type II secretion system protein GspD [Deinococcus sp.]|uniref:type II secretion system protein GspD n=1 Tax=Deinococcus sp. TaxID=47478 RepID=UPI003C79F70C